MRVAVFSDIHGNLPALETFVKDTQGKVDGYICLGDVVNYGPWNDECLEMVLALPGIILLQGNHERLFLGEDMLKQEIPLVQEFFRYSCPHFTRRDLICRLPSSVEIGNYLCVHTIDRQRIYPNTAISVFRNHFVGHTHYPCKVQSGPYVVVNTGSVGQNRQRGDRICYAVYDVDTGRVDLCESVYPWQRMLDEMHVRGYSRVCLEYYEKKIHAGRGDAG